METSLNIFTKKRLRRILRGYAKLRGAGACPQIIRLKNRMLDTPLGISRGRVSTCYFGAGADQAENLVRDFLFNGIGHYSLNQSLLAGLGQFPYRVAHPLPKAWRDILESEGWIVARGKSRILWAGFLLGCWAYGVALFLQKLLKGMGGAAKAPGIPQGSFVHFSGLTKNELPSTDGEKRWNIVSWYLQWSGRKTSIAAISHNVWGSTVSQSGKIPIFFHDPLGPLPGLGKNLLFLIWGLQASFWSLTELLRGRWWHALLLGEFVKSYLFQNSCRRAIAYLFPAHTKRRPLWTHEAEKAGSRLQMYFYSTNCDLLQRHGPGADLSPHFRKISWPEILVWDEEQKNWLRRCEAVGELRVVGPIWFSDSDLPLPKMGPKTLAVFDVTPRRISTYAWLGVPDDYYCAKTMIRFFMDIVESAEKAGWRVVWKGKRKTGIRRLEAPPRLYLKTIQDLVESGRLTPVEPEISAVRILKGCGAAVSIPYSSTSVIAQALGKSSCFYDPLGKLRRGDPSAHGIALVQGKESLIEFLEQDESA